MTPAGTQALDTVQTGWVLTSQQSQGQPQARGQNYIYIFKRCGLCWTLLGAVTRARVRGGSLVSAPICAVEGDTLPRPYVGTRLCAQKSAEHGLQPDKSQLSLLTLRAAEGKPEDLKRKTRSRTGVGQMVQLVECSLHRHKDLRSTPAPTRKPVVAVGAVIPVLGRWKDNLCGSSATLAELVKTNFSKRPCLQMQGED